MYMLTDSAKARRCVSDAAVVSSALTQLVPTQVSELTAEKTKVLSLRNLVKDISLGKIAWKDSTHLKKLLEDSEISNGKDNDADSGGDAAGNDIAVAVKQLTDFMKKELDIEKMNSFFHRLFGYKKGI